MKTEKAGRPFERLVVAVQKKLAPGSSVYSPHRVVAKSGVSVPLDGAVLGKLGSASIFVAIEAKDWKDPVGPERSVRSRASSTT